MRHSMLQERAEMRVAKSQLMLRRRRQYLRRSGQGLCLVLQAGDEVLLQRDYRELLRGRSDVRQRHLQMRGRAQAMWQHVLQDNRDVCGRTVLPENENGLRRHLL